MLKSAGLYPKLIACLARCGWHYRRRKHALGDARDLLHDVFASRVQVFFDVTFVGRRQARGWNHARGDFDRHCNQDRRKGQNHEDRERNDRNPIFLDPTSPSTEDVG